MNRDLSEIAIGLEWVAFFFGFLLFAIGEFRTAREVDGRFRWPVSGRWILVGFLAWFSFVCLNVARLRLEPAFLEPIIPTSGPDAPTNWFVFFAYLPAVGMLFWVTWRVRHGGLTHHHPTSDAWREGSPDRRLEVRR